MVIKTPGKVLNDLLKKYDLNCNRLAKAIGMSNAMVRLLALDKAPISVSAAFRLAKFFKTKPEYWLDLQTKYDLSKAAKDKKLAKDVKGIVDVTKYSFERKAVAAKKGKKKVAKKAGAKKTAKRAVGRKKTKTLATKRRTAAKAPGARRPRRARRVTRRK